MYNILLSNLCACIIHLQKKQMAQVFEISRIVKVAGKIITAQIAVYNKYMNEYYKKLCIMYVQPAYYYENI